MNRKNPVLNLHPLLRGVLLAALLSGALGASLPTPAAAAATWYVSPTGNDNNTCTSEATACLTITAALNRANSGDVINILPGQYDENVTIAENLTLIGAGADTTIIDGGGIGPVVLVTSESGGTTATLSGLTLENGLYGLGGGVHSESGTGLLSVSNSRIVNNTAQTGGGGIFSQGNLKLTNVVIQGNNNTGQQRGGGILSLGSAELINVTISANTAPAGGGGIGNLGTLTVTNSFIGDGNQGGSGGGIANYGAGAKVILNGTSVSRNIATISGGGGLSNEGGQLIIATSTITGNQAIGSGGGIYNTKLGQSVGQLNLSASVVQNNSTGSSGGGLNNEAQATLDTATFMGNRAEVSGGALYNSTEGQLTFTNGALRNNTATTAQGGGLRNLGTAVVNSAQLIDNIASSGSGGGIENGSGVNATASLTVNSSELTGNQALGSLGGGLHNYAVATLIQVKLQNNQANGGGGVYNEATGALTLRNNTILSNTAVSIGGGGVNNNGTLTVNQSTLAYNTTTQSKGGGLFNIATANLTNVTISGNTAPGVSGSGGALYNDGGDVQFTHATLTYNLAPAVVNVTGNVAIVNSIVASSTNGLNCNGSISSSGNNLDSGTSCGFSGGSFNDTNPLLGPLQNNGGGTPTHALFVSSPAVDNAGGAQCVGVSIDQRGVTRPQGNGCDIGAYEIIGFTNSTPGPIAAGQCTTSTTNVPSSLVIGSLNVGANVTFQPRGDLRIRLYSPGHGIAQLLDNDPSDTGHNLDVLWDDTAPDPVGTENYDPAFPYYDLSRHPDHPLSVMVGGNSLGAWQLEICNIGSSAGTLNRWTLIVPSIGNPKVFLPLIRR